VLRTHPLVASLDALPVLLKNDAELRSLSMVVAEEPAKAFLPHDVTTVMIQPWRGSDTLLLKPLMMTLGMIMGQILLEHIGE
jgi:hypothetical protein